MPENGHILFPFKLLQLTTVPTIALAIADLVWTQYSALVAASNYFAPNNLTKTILFSGKYTLVGVVSYGWGCASSAPGIYARVQGFLPWIKNLISSGECSGSSSATTAKPSGGATTAKPTTAKPTTTAAASNGNDDYYSYYG